METFYQHCLRLLSVGDSLENLCEILNQAHIDFINSKNKSLTESEMVIKR